MRAALAAAMGALVLATSVAALADPVPMPRRSPCAGRRAGAACIQPDGHAGVCRNVDSVLQCRDPHEGQPTPRR